ncbi:MAG: glycerol-3-phosphate 1-O-acyltransferase PlsY [Lachnospiraceae bacterium]|nr:glycerol-3-phosphate 1-O-acyltransferase PlsY [Lachnospiraceae bacterium]
MILARILCLAGGYLCGLLQTSYIYGRLNGIDIREYGSGNAGTTNALRVLGKKAGLVVFLGDVFKAVIAVVAVRLIMKGIYPNEVYMFIAYAGFGVVLGHNFPFYLKFKGGKGIAATAGVVLGFLDPVIILTCLVVFTIAVAITRYVSLGSILMVTTFATMYTIFALSGKYSFDLNVAASKECMIESVIVVIVMALMAIYRHKANIKRLINHEENKLGSKKEA